MQNYFTINYSLLAEDALPSLWHVIDGFNLHKQIWNIEMMAFEEIAPMTTNF